MDRFFALRASFFHALAGSLGSAALAAPAAAQGIQLNGLLARSIAGDVLEVQLSPDGSRVVYRADQDQDEVFELYSAPLAGGPALRLSGPLPAGGDVEPGFRISADSARVVYLADQDANDFVELYSVPLGGGTPLQLNAPFATLGEVRSFLISPDASRVVYRADHEVLGRIELYSVSITGGPATKLNGAMTPAGDVLGAGDVRIAPDSSRVVYRADQDADQVFELFSVPLAGGTALQLNAALPAGGDVEPSFECSPDSSRVVYLADQDANDVLELYGVPLAGGAPVRLNPALVAGGDVRAGFAVAPDASRVVYTADQDVDEQFELFSVPLAGGAATKLNHPLVAAADVQAGFRIAPDASRVVYDATGTTSVRWLHAVPLAGGAAVQLDARTVEADFQVTLDSSAVVSRGLQPGLPGLGLARAPLGGGVRTVLAAPGSSRAVESFALVADGVRLVYRSDQDADELFELFGVALAGGPATQLNPALAAGGDVQPVYVLSADGSRAVYLADQADDGVVELYGVPPAGGAATRLSGELAPSAETVGAVARARTSADRRWVVYLATQDDPNDPGLYRVALPSGTPRRIDTTAWVERFELSPDSSRVVFTGDGRSRLHVAPLASGPALLLDPAFPPDLELASLAISPDSSHVVFAADAGGDGDFQLFSVPLAGGTTVQLDTGSGGLDFDFVSLDFVPALALASDASRVVYRADRDTPGVAELFSVPLAGGPATRLHPPLAAPRRIQHFHLSPDASRVVYRGDVDQVGVDELYSVPLAGGAATRLNPALVPGGEVLGQAVISADSSRVVYRADQEIDEVVELYSVPLAGGTALELNAPLVAGGDVFGDSGPEGNGLLLSPDGSRVLYLADQEVDGRIELYVVPVDGSASPLKLNGPLIASGDVGIATTELPHLAFHLVMPRISPDGEWVVYLADPVVDERFELHAVPLAGGTPQRLSAALPPGEALAFDFAISSDSTRVLYRAGPEPTRGARFHEAPLDGSAPARDVTPALVPDGQVWSFEERGGLVLYRAEQDEVGVIELYLSFLTRPHRRAR
ncbi:MAG TPA: hypothetical protein VF530_16575 [Planctomycetota bacterium]